MRIIKGRYEPEEQDLTFLNASLGHISNYEICQKLHISKYILERIVCKYFPTIARNKKNVLTLKEEQYIIEKYPYTSNSEIYQSMGISRKSFFRVVAKYDLKKDDEYIANEKAKNANKFVRNGKVVQPCSGRFCERKGSCAHHTAYIENGKPVYGQFLNGCTTRCINNLTYTYYIENE